MKLFTKQTHRQRKQSYGYQRGKGRKDKLGVLDWQIYIHIDIKQINNKDVLIAQGTTFDIL